MMDKTKDKARVARSYVKHKGSRRLSYTIHNQTDKILPSSYDKIVLRSVKGLFLRIQTVN